MEDSRGSENPFSQKGFQASKGRKGPGALCSCLEFVAPGSWRLLVLQVRDFWRVADQGGIQLILRNLS